MSKRKQSRKETAGDNFEAKSRTFHGDTYDYTLVKYNGSKVDVEIICKVHGVFRQTPSNHFKFGCNKCGTARTTEGQTGSLGKFAGRILSKFGKEVYAYKLAKYTTAKDPITVECLECGDTILSTPDNLLSRQYSCGCKTKHHGGFKPYLPATLYYLRVEYLGKVAYKIGITNRTVAERFVANNKGRITVLKEWEFVSGKEAIDEETRIKQDFKVYKWCDEAMLRDGNSELFDRDILELDKAAS